MRRATTRFWSVVLICTMFMSLPPVGALAEETTEPLALTETTGGLSQTAADDFQSSPGTGADARSDDAVVEIYSVEDLAAAIAGQKAGQTWKIAAGVYSLTQDHLNQYAHWDAPGQGGWYFPLYADRLTLVGEGRVVITSAVESANGAWATQDFVSVWGDGITIDGVDFQSKSVPNKAIEIMGRDFTLKNCTILPVVHPDGENGEVFSGSIFFNPINDQGDLGDSTLENVYLHGYISASAADAGTLHVRNVTLDATNNIWSVWGTGYGPGLVGDVYGQIENVKYLVDEGAILSDILDSNSPYAADTKPGTTIVFAAGTYELNSALTIGKDLALVGAGWERTVFQAAAEPVVLLQVSGGAVDFSMSGIHVKGVDSNSHNNSSGIQIGTNGTPNTGQIVIEKCKFSDFTKNSITVKGGNAAITGNLIDCKPYPGAAGNGIQIDMGAVAVITGNTINGYVSHADSWSARGVLVLRDGKINRIRDNTFSDCGTGITKETYYDTDDHQTYLDPEAAKNNTFVNCGQNVDFEFDLMEEIAANSGGVVRLPCDVALDETLTISTDLILDGNGFTVYGREGVCIEVTGGTFQLSNVTLAGFGGENGAQTGVIRVPATAASGTEVIASDVHVRDFRHRAYDIAAGSFKITGGTIDGSGSGPDAAGQNTTALEISGNADVDVIDCVIRHVRRGIHVDNSRPDIPGDVTVDISGTSIAAQDDAVLLSGNSDADSRAAVRILDGTFTGDIRIENETDRHTISITGGSFSVDPTPYVATGYHVINSGGVYTVRPETPDGERPDGGGSSGGGSSGGSSDSPNPPTQPQPSEPETSDGNTTVSTQVTPTVSGDTARAEVDTGVMDKTVESVLEAAAENDTAPVVQIVVDSGKANNVEVLLPVSSLDTLGRHESAALTVTSGVATVTLDSAAITAVANQAGGEQIALAVAPVAAEDLNEQQQAAVGGAPVFDLHLRSDDITITHFGGGTATVSIPYRLPSGQTADDVVVYYLDDLGNLTPRETSYDATEGKATFTTPHFSKYVVGYRQVSRNPFTDVTETSYFYTPVLWAAEQGITLGTSETTFSPYKVCTRARAAVLLWRAAGSPKPERTASPFTDVTRSDDYYDAVLLAVEQGITSGTSATTFSPDALCTRAQIVTFLWRYNKGIAAETRIFTDVAETAYYRQAVLWAVQQGITVGTTESTFSPDAPCTRAQIVTFLFRYMGE